MLHLNNNPTTTVGLVKKGALAVAALLATCLLVFTITGCSSGSKEDVDTLAHSYAQRMSELVWSCTQGKTDAVVEVSLRSSDLSFSLSIPAGEEISRTTERLETIWKSGVDAKKYNASHQKKLITYRRATIKWSENGQVKTASDSNGDFHLDTPDQEQ